MTDPDDTTRRTEFVFERKGIFNWKLERIVLPSHKAASGAGPAVAAKPAA